MKKIALIILLTTSLNMKAHFKSGWDLIQYVRYTSSRLLFDAMVISQLYKNIIKIKQINKQNNESKNDKIYKLNRNI